MKHLITALAHGLAYSLTTGHALAAPICNAKSAAPPTVVELYTSEGCSSCPPADRWASTLKGRSDTITLAFHVSYWDKLGWPDRFASPAFTERQHQRAALAGSSYVYTPQVVVDGRDWRSWPSLPPRLSARAGTSASLALTLNQQGGTVTAHIDAAPGLPQLSGYWAVLEDQHVSKVRAGENAGETLRHDHVVRLYKPVASWGGASAQRATLEVSAGSSEHPRRAVFVVTEPTTQRPLQALALALNAAC